MNFKMNYTSVINQVLVTVSLLLAAPLHADMNSELRKAAMNGDVDQVKELIEQGVNVNAKDEKGRTALMVAAKSNSVDSIILLIGAGAEIDMVDENGSTALMVASIHGSIDAIQKLVYFGSDLELKDNNGHTPYNLTTEYGHFSAELLVRELRKQPDCALITPLRLVKLPTDDIINAIQTVLKIRKWSIISNDGEDIVASYKRQNRLYIVNISLTEKFMMTRFVRGYGTRRFDYIKKIKKEIENIIIHGKLSPSKKESK